MFEMVLPQDSAVLHQEQPWHHTAVGFAGTSGKMPFAGCPQAAHHHPWRHELAYPAPFNAKCPVKMGGQIGDSAGFRPGFVEKCLPIFYIALVEKQDRWESGVVLTGLPYILHGFFAERSAKVAQKDQ